MESIPSAMYFCLVNLFGEFPLMERHSSGGRFVCVFVAIVGQVIMGIPCGLLGGAFQEHVESSRGNKDTSDDKKDQLKLQQTSETATNQQHDHDRKVWQVMQIINGRKVQVIQTSGSTLDLGALYRKIVLAAAVGSFARLTIMHLATIPTSVLLIVQTVNICTFFVLVFEYCARVAAERRGVVQGRYFQSMWAVVDLLAFLPDVVLLAMPNLSDINFDIFLCIQTTAQMLKLERFLHGFRIFGDLTKDCRHVFGVTALFAMIIWLVCSVLMFYAEAQSPIEEMQRYYVSVPTSMWVTMLNLTGECPIVDYGLMGRWVTGLMGLLAVGFFTVPFGLMSGGFEEYLQDDVEDEKHDGPSAQENELKVSMPRNIVQESVLAFINGTARSTTATLFKWLSISFTVINVIQTMVESVEGLMPAGSSVDVLNTYLKNVVVGFFTVEFCLRVYSARMDPRHWSRRRYLLSLSGIIDVLTIGPYYLTYFKGGSGILHYIAVYADRYDEDIRLLRVLRLAALDNHIPSVCLVFRVFQNPVILRELQIASYVGGTMWFIFSCLLSLCERWNPDEPEQRERFGTVLDAMPFTLVHMTGDYPLIDYTLLSKVVHGMMLALGSGFVAVPAAIISRGFRKELEDSRNAAGSTSASDVAEGVDIQVDAQSQKLPTPVSKLCLRAQKLLSATNLHRWLIALTAVNVAAVLLESMPRVQMNPILTRAIVGIELLSGSIFTAEYILRILAAPADPSSGFSRCAAVTSFVGIVDLISILPLWLDVALFLAGFDLHLEAFQVLRVLRLLRFEDDIEAFGVLMRVFQRSRSSMAASGIIGMLIWILSAVLFHESERGNPQVNGAFDSLPSSLYYTAVFLADEWAEVDFTPMGKILMVGLCAVAIGLAGIPIGSLFDAFADEISEGE